ncbi:hypothetical protein [Priestia koreensis]|uniref:hypothetical protein n=1 Tax=Priestia koreensis TaxID=284581 RepID=UPI00345AFA61
MDEILTEEEQALIKKLKMAMLDAVSTRELKFYKKEMIRIKDQAKRRSKIMDRIAHHYQTCNHSLS